MAMAEETEKWVKGVAITTTILAVCTAVSSLKASSYSTRVQINTTLRADAWAFYQAKSLKEHTYRMQKDSFEFDKLLAGQSPEAQSYADQKIKSYADEVVRYTKEKDEIKKQAEGLEKQEDLFKQHNASFALAVMMLQVAILMSSIAALMKWKYMWFLGLAFGVVGLFYMANGFFLFV